MKWRYSHYELLRKIEMKMQECQANHLTFFNSIVEVVSAAFGGKKDGNTSQGPITEDLTKLDTQSYVARANQLLSGNI